MVYRIALVSAYYAPHIGGVERYTENLANKLASQGHQVTVITSSPSYKDWVLETGVRLIAVPAISIMNDRFPLFKPTIRCLKTFRMLMKMRFDAVIVNTRYYLISLLGCGIAHRCGFRPIVIDHSSGYLSRTDSLPGLAIRIWEKTMTLLLKCFNPAYYGVSQGSVNWLKLLHIDAYGIIPNSIDVDAYKQIQSKRNWKEELSLSDDTCIITYVGRLIPEKGIMKLIAAMDIVTQRDSRTVLIIAGNGLLQKEVEQAASNHIVYVGALNAADTSALLSESDVFCLPTEYPEGLPTVLLEAAIQGNAIVTSNCAGAVEVIPDRSYGAIIDNVNPGNLAEEILHYVSNPEERQKASCKVANRVYHSFTWDTTAKSVIDIIDATYHE